MLGQCVDSRDYVVAHYNLKPPEKPAYTTSGNILTIYEPFTHLAVGVYYLPRCTIARQVDGCTDETCLTEILTTLTIMRHLAASKY